MTILSRNISVMRQHDKVKESALIYARYWISQILTHKIHILYIVNSRGFNSNQEGETQVNESRSQTGQEHLVLKGHLLLVM